MVGTEPAATQCGVKRWRVKIVADPDAENVRIDWPQKATIEQLSTIRHGAYAEGNPRSSAEEQVYTVEGWLAGYELESSDSDLHVVIKDDSGRSMIVEFPHPDCMGASRVLRQAAAARTKFLGMLRTPPKTRYLRLENHVRVRVTGVVFFDHLHGQVGVASNGVELHPVLDIERVRTSRLSVAP